ncbi:MAG: hypothetical protein U0822_22255 [Anaerolineae bacterium]
MITEPPRYLAYMLRLWQVGSENGPAWRVSLESPHTGERRMFASLDALLAFLRAETEGSFFLEPLDILPPIDPPGGRAVRPP